MAGVAAIPLPSHHRLIPSQMAGTDFLSTSHFHIAQDNSTSQAGFKSVFKKDYIPWEISSKPQSTVPPRPAEVLHRDDRFFNDKASETCRAYTQKPLPAIEPKGHIQSTLRATNFKMDRDLAKFNSFDTTHNLAYPPKYNGPRVQGNQGLKPMDSSIPQGDPIKAPQPLSDYRDKFRGHSGAAKPDRAVSMHQVGPDTITGDGRLHHFNTTHNDTYFGKAYARVAAYPAPSGTNIPQGDIDKVITKMTTAQESFPQHDLESRQYDKNAVMSKLQKTNFIQGDGHGTWNDYTSTFTSSYKPKIGSFSRSAPTKHRNHSDFPVGDEDPWRLSERANTTTNRFYHGTVLTPKANIVSGANKRTKSNVWFGEPGQSENYDTTTNSTFKPAKLPDCKAGRPDHNTRSCVPVDYYPNEHHVTTTYSDFQDPKTGKMNPNAAALANLKNSHIKAPLGGERQFSTEHLDQYIPKSTLRDNIDPGRLQRSSVPLGTLKI